MVSTLIRSATLALTVAVAGSLIQTAAFAQAAPAASVDPAQRVGAKLLDGKLTFAVPPGFAGSALPDGTPQDGTANTTGAVFANYAQQQMILVSEQSPLPDGIRIDDNATTFLDGIMESFLANQKALWKQYQRLGEKSLTIKGLGLRQLDAIASFEGKPMRVTMLLAGSGNALANVRITSNADDADLHNALVANVLDGIRVSR